RRGAPLECQGEAGSARARASRSSTSPPRYALPVFLHRVARCAVGDALGVLDVRVGPHERNEHLRGRVAFVAVAVAVVASACDGPRGPEARGVTASPQAPGRDDRERRDQAAALMLRFAERTGLTSARAERRYLWTDAFAVCNFLGLARATGEARYTELALRL